MQIGKLERVELRELWKHEQYDFSKWLAGEENIKELNSVLKLTLVDIEKEKPVGSFRCDIFAKDEITGSKVLIENQLEPTNHDHLGKIITYGALLEANVIVWIVERARDEHKKAIEWLNNHIDKEISFFLLEIHAYKIGNSLPAPMFKVIEAPNDFANSVRRAEKEGINESESQRLVFRNELNELIDSRGYPFNKRTPTTNYWYNVAIGSTSCRIGIHLLNNESRIRICIYIPESKELYDEFLRHKDEIEKELGYSLEWNRMDDSKSSMVSKYINGLNFNNHSNYKELMNEIIDAVIELRKVFAEYL